MYERSIYEHVIHKIESALVKVTITRRVSM